MELPELTFERYECLEGTWTPMADGEDHFVGIVRQTVYSPGIFGTTTQTLKTIRFAVPRAPYTQGPSEIVYISSDSEEEPSDLDEDPDYVPSDASLSSMSEDGSDSSGYTASPELPPSPEYHPGPMEDELEVPVPVHADGDVPVVPVVAAAVSAEEEDPEEDPDDHFHVPEEDIIIIDSPSDSDPESDESVMIVSDPDF